MKVNQTKSFFFDRARVLKAADAQTRQVLSKFGAFVRRTSKGLIRKGKKAAKPGNPPHSHSGLLKKFIYFSWDPSARSVVIGPAKLNGAGTGQAPRALEKGGTSTISSRARIPGKFVTINHKRVPALTTNRVKRTVRIAARPYMGPAVAKELPTLPREWSKGVRSS
jgi:hypothetical protein